ncbi:MAG: hypothetical protein HYU66_00805 [Armatimonadetes bacterium]|nr:hypothetical protein [Armatimonadota bacterium]
MAEALRLAFTGLTDTLAARQHGAPPAEAWDEFVAAREALRAQLDPPAGRC